MANNEPKLTDIKARFFSDHNGERIFKVMSNRGIVEIPEKNLRKSEKDEHNKVCRLLHLHERIVALEQQYVTLREELFPEPGTFKTIDGQYQVSVKTSNSMVLKNRKAIEDALAEYLDKFQGDVPDDQQGFHMLVQDLIRTSVKNGPALNRFMRLKATPKTADAALVKAQRLIQDSIVPGKSSTYVNVHRVVGGKLQLIRKHVNPVDAA